VLLHESTTRRSRGQAGESEIRVTKFIFVFLQLKEKINNIIRILEKEFPDLPASAPRVNDSKESWTGRPLKPSESDPLDVLIATMLSQNTTDKTSYRAFMNLKNDFRGWKDIMEAPLPKIRSAIKVCGLAGQKSKSIRELLRKIFKKYGSLSLSHIKKLTDKEIYDELIEYNGIGIKTISCVLAFGLGRDVFPVDTHVHRLANRLGLAKAKTPDKTFSQLSGKIPAGKKFLLHTLLIRFGRKICKAKTPLCSNCVLFDICEFKEKEYFAGLLQSSKSKPKENNFIILEHV
jgi:endonuclease-3